MKYVTVLAILILSVAAFGDTLDPDPVGFCAGPTTTMCSGDPNLIGATSFTMIKNGDSSYSSVPWYLLVALPNYTGLAPTLNTNDFTLESTTDLGQFLPTTSGSIYDFANLIGDASMNATNMFGAAEQTAFGGTPDYFEVFAYEYAPAFQGAFHNYSFTVGGEGLVAGTFLAASGGSNPFSTPFTTTGLVSSPPSVPDGSMTVMLLGGVLVVLETLRRRLSA